MSLDLAASKEKIKEIESLKLNLEKEVTTKLYESSHLSDELANLKSKFDVSTSNIGST